MSIQESQTEWNELKIQWIDTLKKSGWDQDWAEKAVEWAKKVKNQLEDYRSVLTLKDWTYQLNKVVDEDFLKTPEWKKYRLDLARLVGLVPFAETQCDKEWSKWYFKEHEALETSMIELASLKDNRHQLEESLVDFFIQKRPQIAQEQADAAKACCLGQNAVVITEGTAGAGKSYTLEVIKEVYENAPGTVSYPRGYDIIGTALSWTAAKVLQESAKLSGAKALEGLLLDMKKAKKEGREYFKKRTLIIVDEAGLVGTKKMNALLKYAHDSAMPVRVLLTGDSFQLNPVEAGNALEAIVDACGSSRLDKIRRQERESHRQAVKAFSQGKAEQGLWTYWQQECLILCKNAEERQEKVVEDYVRCVAEHPLDTHLVLALENADVKELNQVIRNRLKELGLLAGIEHELCVNDGHGDFLSKFCVGDRIVFRKNLKDQTVHESQYDQWHEAAHETLKKGQKEETQGLFSKMISGFARGNDPAYGKEIRKGVFNRSSGLILSIKKNPASPDDRLIRVLLSEGGEALIDTADLRDKDGKKGMGIAMHHNCATTIYASQGQTVKRVFLLDSPYMNRRLAYVGMSRHQLECQVYADEDSITQRKKKRAELESAFAKNEREKKRLKDIQEKESFTEGELWSEVALTWNKESKNPTVLQERKIMEEKKNSKEGTKTGWLYQAEGSDPDDEAQEKVWLKRKKPRSYDAWVRFLRAKKEKETQKKGFFGQWLKSDDSKETEEVLEEVAPVWPEWTNQSWAKKTMEELEGMIWKKSRWDEPRVLSLDREGCIMARWDLDGHLKAGRGEVPVLPNTENSPWMMVEGFREAFISWSFYKDKWKENPEKMPSIAVGLKEADLTTLKEWIPQDRVIYCAWSSKNEGSLAWAERMQKRLEENGWSTELYPKKPAASVTSKPKH